MGTRTATIWALAVPTLAGLALLWPIACCPAERGSTGRSAAEPARVAARPSASANEAFEAAARDFLQRYLELEPVRATALGEHRHDGRWPKLDAEAQQQRLALIDQSRAVLEAIDIAELGVQHRIDWSILHRRLAGWAFDLTALRRWERDPLYYTELVGDGLDPLVTRDFAPGAERLQSLLQRLDALPQLLAQARENLRHPPRLHTETAIEQNRGLVALVREQVPQSFERLPGRQLELREAVDRAARALEGFGGFLEGELLARSDGDFRLGRQRFEQKLGFELEAEVSADKLALGARALLARTREQMLETATALWPELFAGQGLPPTDTSERKAALIRRVLGRIAEDAPTDQSIVAEARELTQRTTEFVRQRRLVSVPDEPVEVIEMPEYRRGVAIAYCDAPGVLEPVKQTFFAIAPTPAGWSAERAASFYREYNRSMLAELTIHEAVPGHFLQLAHANRFGSLVRAVFDSGPFIEGWAVYAEWLMAQHGFGGLRVRMQREKMVLRLAANAILDHGVHAGTMTEAQAMALMMEQAFQEEGEAAGKWTRARLTSAQLSTYYYGFREVLAMRQRAEQLPGFEELSFHDRLLSYGSPPCQYLRHLLFGDEIRWR